MMDTEMEFVPINNIKQEKEAEAPTSVCGDENNSNNTAAEQPDSVENKVSATFAKRYEENYLGKSHMTKPYFLPALQNVEF